MIESDCEPRLTKTAKIGRCRKLLPCSRIVYKPMKMRARLSAIPEAQGVVPVAQEVSLVSEVQKRYKSRHQI